MIRKKIKGFTLMEVVVAMFIFVLVISASTAAFANMFRSYKDAKNIQENMENAQYAMNIMAKTFRTSSVITSPDSNGSSTIEVYDYSQDECFRYSFNSSTKTLEVAGGGSADDSNNPSAGCSGFSGYNAMTNGQVIGKFSFEASDDDSSNPKVGKITVSMTITEGSNVVNLQTTTSLRDYVKSGISL